MIRSFSWIFGVLALVVLVFGLHSAWNSYQFARSASEAQGTVVEVNKNTVLRRHVPDESDIGKVYTSSVHEETRYRATIRYLQPETGVEAIAVQALERKYEVGDIVPILVTSKEVRISSFNALWGLPLAALLGGLWVWCLYATSAV